MSMKTLGRPEGLYRYNRTVHYTYQGVRYTWGACVREDTQDAADNALMDAFEKQHSSECLVTHISN